MASHKINYRPLDDSRREIRVLCIEPRRSELEGKEPSELVACTLKHISLDSKPLYHALSYTWHTHGVDTQGPSSSEVESPRITVDGQEVSVTRNLLLALTQFRDFLSLPTGEYFAPFPANTQLWVDALCINQKDIPERNQQVRKMRQIYENAEIVNLWLGPDLEDSDLGMGIAADLEQRVRLLGNTKVEEEWINPLMRGKLQEPENHDSWASLSNIFRRPYWQRVWIVQELVTNMRTYVHVGSKTTHLMPLLVSASTMLDADNLPDGLLEKSSLIDSRVIIADRWSFMDPAYKGHHLFDILCNYRHHLCSNPSDKVYGFASLARPYDNGDLDIDYDLFPGIVFQNTARFIIEGTKRLDVICVAEQSSCQCPTGAHAKLGLQSWVPNWSCVPLAWDRMRFESQIPWKAALESDAVVDFSPDGRLLICEGLKIGSIERIHLLPQGELPWRETLIEFHRLLTFLCNDSSLSAPPTMLLEETPVTTVGASKTLWEIFFSYLGIEDLVSTVLTQENFQALFSAFLTQPLDQTLYEEHGKDLRKVFKILGERGIISVTLAATLSPSPTPLTRSSSALGACSPIAQEGDLLVLLYGCKTLVLLRNDGDGERYQMVSAASLNGYMFGEAMGMFEERQFVIH